MGQRLLARILQARRFLHTYGRTSGLLLSVGSTTALTWLWWTLAMMVMLVPLGVEPPASVPVGTRSEPPKVTAPLPPMIDPAYSVGSLSFLDPPEVPAPAEDPPPREPGSGGDVLACLRNRESHSNYQAVNPSSGASGAYQFLPSTWDRVAAHIDRPDLIGVEPASTSDETQDQMAVALIEWQGLSPWAGSGC